MLDIFLTAFVTFFVVVDPPGLVPVFAALTHKSPAAYRRRLAVRGTAIAAGILLFFALAGRPFLGALGITLEALRVAGGIMLFVIALEMVFEKRTQRRESAAERTQQEHADDISVFPLAIPLLAGPGAIASAILLMAAADGDWVAKAVVLGALALTLLLALAAFLATGPVMRLLGTTVSAILSRVLGVVLAALAAQFVMDGIRAFFAVCER